MRQFVESQTPGRAIRDTKDDGYGGTAPVGCFKPNGYGIRVAPGQSPRRVIKGGSHLCAPNFCSRYRPAARQPQETDLGAGHLGFRTVLNKPAGVEGPRR